MDLTHDFIREDAKAVDNLKSKIRYLKVYDDFMKWRAENEVNSFSEKDLLMYFEELSKTYKPSTLWSVYSMLKTTLNTKHNVYLNEFYRLSSFIKRQAEGFESKKSNVFTSQEVETFLNEAPDGIYLLMKVVLVLGVCGACRCNELVNMKVDDLEKQGEIILVKLRWTKIKRTFVIKKEFVHVIEKYQKLRPSMPPESNRFLINYHKGRCFPQVIGKNTMTTFPKKIASYLNLPNPHLYAGHCFRRTSATLLADSGGDETSTNRSVKDGGSSSRSTDETYIEVQVENNIY